MTVVQRSPEIAAVLALLRSQLTVGDAVRPSNWATAPAGYAVLYPMNSPVDGPNSDPYADTEAEYQVTSVGQTRAQATKVADDARTLMLTGSLSIPGRALMQPVEWDGEQSRGAERDDDTNPPLFYAVDRYVIRTTPS